MPIMNVYLFKKMENNIMVLKRSILM